MNQVSPKTATALFRLTRPGNAIICGLSVITGSVIAGRPSDMLIRLVTEPSAPWSYRTWAAAISAALILAAGNVYNDVRDVATDRVNAPNRPLAAGLVSPAAATVWAVILAMFGLTVSIPVGASGTGIAIAAVLLLVLYDIRLKGVPLAGNLAVALLGWLAFVYGGVAGGAIMRSLVPAGFALLFHLAREIVKDAADVRGDCAVGVRTIATTKGVITAGRMSGWVLVMLAVTVGAPWLTGYFGGAYFAMILVGVWPVLAHAIRVLFRQPGVDEMKRLAVALKLDMPVGLLAVLAGFQWMG